MRLTKPTDAFLVDVTAGLNAASKAVVLDANSKIDALDITAPKINGTAVTSTAAELNVLDGVARGSIVLGKAAGTGVLDANDDGKILIGDGTDLKSVAVTGAISITNAGVVSLALPKLAVISKACAIGDFTDNAGTATGYIDFPAASLPAGAIPIAVYAVITEGFSGDTTAVLSVGVAGDLARFTADATQSVVAPGTVGAFITPDKALDGFGAASVPRVTITGTGDFTSINAGAMTVYIIYVATA